jgi:protein translocase SecG subunit
MFWIIGLLYLVLVLDSAILILLILIQLPKKEAGLGQAFGGAATDALFGAGSGNALTKMTKYATVIFFGATLLLSVVNAQAWKSKKGSLEQRLQRAAREIVPVAATPAPAAAPQAETPVTATKPAAPATAASGGLLSAGSNAIAKPAPIAPAPTTPPANASAPAASSPAKAPANAPANPTPAPANPPASPPK